MTKHQALKKAQELFGPVAFVTRRSVNNRNQRFLVGFIGEVKPLLMGAGDSWEKALEQADKYAVEIGGKGEAKRVAEPK